jgi:SAM-dependent methyltransferase
LRDRSDSDWEELARNEPYFAVLTERRFLSAGSKPRRLAEFFATGEADIHYLLELASTWRGSAIEPRNALDFGCGTGRLTLALAQLAERVTGVDAAPTMLRLADQHRISRGIVNVALASNLDALPAGSFDFICSLIVFQHIPVARGERLFRRLLELLEPGGVIAAHFVFDRPGGRWKRIGRRMRGSFPVIHRLLQWTRREPLNLPYMQMNNYDRARIASLVEAAGCDEPAFVATERGGIGGAIVLTARRHVR